VGDSRRLQQVILNVVGNAIKFTEQGRVVLAVSLETPTSPDMCSVAKQPSDSDPLDAAQTSEAANCSHPDRSGKVMLHFAVSDTGIGIAAENLGRIFSPFTQADSTLTRAHSGTGLGLAIAREIVEQMGGQIWAQSELGRGSCFHWTARFGIAGSATARESSGVEPACLPVRHSLNRFDTCAIAAPGRHKSIPGSRDGADELSRRLRILVIDDTRAIQQVTQAILAKRGHIVEFASNGYQAIEKVRQTRFDVVLMDVQMPAMDGLQATAAIRRMESPSQPRLPIIAMTAHALPEDRIRCAAAGMEAYITKPVDAEELVHLVESLGSSTESRSRRSNQGDPMPTNDSKTNMHSSNRPTQLFDREAALERLGGNERLFAKLAQIFCEDSPPLVEELKSALHAGNAAALAQAAHALVGMAANFDAHTAVDAARRVEAIGQSDNLDQAAEAVTELVDAVTQLNAELVRYQAINPAEAQL
jgi:CheY-like chemotaxis protein